VSTASEDRETGGLSFTVAGSGETFRLTGFDLVVAGYTGRDEGSVRKHIDELAAIGVPPPESVPAFYPLDAALATQAPEVTVAGRNTSGEVEPVLIRAGGRLYLGVGSDHTDRDIERDSVAASKAACPKPVAAQVVALPVDGDGTVTLDWDTIAARCTVDGAVYQQGTLDALRVPTDVLALLDTSGGGPGEGDLVMFCGTLPLIDGEFVAGREWTLSLTLPDGTVVGHTYAARSQHGQA
jgi:Protein of unknown function (DUF2848)